MMRRSLWVLPFVLFLALVIFFWKGLALDPHNIPSAKIGQVLPAFSLYPLSAQTSPTLFSSSQLPHRTFILHVWASWCASCQAESLVLLTMAQQGIPIYGLNYKDQASSARRFLQRWGNPYVMVLQDPNGKVALDLGVYGTPETFVIDSKGIIRYRHVGILSAQVWENTLLPLVQQGEKLQ